LQLLMRYYKRYTNVRLTMSQFKDLLSAPAPETLSRRRRELQNQKDEEGCLIHPELQPTDRVRRKRISNQVVHEHYYGNGQISLTDYVPCSQREI